MVPIAGHDYYFFDSEGNEIIVHVIDISIDFAACIVKDALEATYDYEEGDDIDVYDFEYEMLSPMEYHRTSTTNVTSTIKNTGSQLSEADLLALGII